MVVWEDELVNQDVMDSMKSSSDLEDRSALKEAMDFLKDELAYSARTVNQLKKAAKEYGLSWGTLIRAKTALKIISKKSGFTGGWMWSLPNELKNITDNQQSKLIPLKAP